MRVLLRRHGDGIGDWLLMLQAMKNINREHPAIELYVDFALQPRGRVPRELSPLVRQAFEDSDVVWKPHTAQHPYDVIVPHVVYERLGYEEYVAGMLRCIGEPLGLELDYDPDLLPQYRTPEYLTGFMRRHAVLVSQSKAETSYKDWGIARFEHVGAELTKRTDCELAQVGAMGDYLLQGAQYRRWLGGPFHELVGVMRSANAVICLENCVAVLASHLHRPTLCIYANVGNKDDGAPRAIGRLGHVAAFVAPSIDTIVSHAERFF